MIVSNVAVVPNKPIVLIGSFVPADAVLIGSGMDGRRDC